MTGFDYFKQALNRYAEFEGRSRRSEYWYFALFNALITYGALGLEMVLVGTTIFYMIVSLAFFIPSFAVAVRRLHDIGKSGWNILWGLLPIIGWILLLIWLCTDSQVGRNKWGPNPKQISDELTDHLIDENSLV